MVTPLPTFRWTTTTLSSPVLFQGDEDSSHLYSQPSPTMTAMTAGFPRRQLSPALAPPDDNDIPNLNRAQ